MIGDYFQQKRLTETSVGSPSVVINPARNSVAKVSGSAHSPMVNDAPTSGASAFRPQPGSANKFIVNGGIVRNQNTNEVIPVTGTNVERSGSGTIFMEGDVGENFSVVSLLIQIGSWDGELASFDDDGFTQNKVAIYLGDTGNETVLNPWTGGNMRLVLTNQDGRAAVALLAG